MQRLRAKFRRLGALRRHAPARLPFGLRPLRGQRYRRLLQVMLLVVEQRLALIAARLRLVDLILARIAALLATGQSQLSTRDAHRATHPTD